MNLKNVLYFNSVRNSTLAVLDSLNNIKHWVKDEDGNDSEKIIPIKFGNYEKSIALEDLDAAGIISGNINIIPRLVLAFRGLAKNVERDTNKFQKISKKIIHPDGTEELQFGYNSVSYDFQYSLVLQARGLNEAFMIVEQILPMFRPSYPIKIREYPLFDDKTETQLQISDPDFDILEGFENTDVNIVTVTFELNLRSNLYMPLQVQGPIKIIKLANWLWDNQNINDSQLAAQYEYDVCYKNGKIYNENVNNQYASPKLTADNTEATEEASECNSGL